MQYQRYPKRRKRKSPARFLLLIVVMLVFMAGSFGAGWHFGVQSLTGHENILLVNATHHLDPDYVPEGLVRLYNQRHSFRLANTDIYLTREAYEAM